MCECVHRRVVWVPSSCEPPGKHHAPLFGSLPRCMSSICVQHRRSQALSDLQGSESSGVHGCAARGAARTSGCCPCLPGRLKTTTPTPARRVRGDPGRAYQAAVLPAGTWRYPAHTVFALRFASWRVLPTRGSAGYARLFTVVSEVLAEALEEARQALRASDGWPPGRAHRCAGAR